MQGKKTNLQKYTQNIPKKYLDKQKRVLYN